MKNIFVLNSSKSIFSLNLDLDLDSKFYVKFCRTFQTIIIFIKLGKGNDVLFMETFIQNINGK